MAKCKETHFVTSLLIFLCLVQDFVRPTELHVIQVYGIGNKGNWRRMRNDKVYEYTAWDAVAPTNSVLYLRCIASYPIEWTFTGHYSPPNNVEFLPPKRSANNSVYQVNVCLVFPEMDHTDWAISVRATCEKIGNPQVEKSLLVFVRKDSHKALLGPSVQTVQDSRLIPCPTKDPNVKPLLYEKRYWGIRRVVDPDIKYNFYEGFRSTEMFLGTHICRWRDSYKIVNASLSDSTNYYDIFPKGNFIRVFSEDTIQFKCASKFHEHVHMSLDDADHRLRVIYTNHSESATVKASSDLSPDNSNNNNNVTLQEKTIQGAGTCSLVVDDTETVVKEWSYEFVNTPELYLNNFFGTFDCVSNIRPMSIHAYRCNNRMECNFVSKYPVSANQCHSSSMNHLSSSEQTFCILGGEEYGRSCVRLPYTFQSGLVQCSVGGLVKQWEFFTSLENRKYTNWKEAPETELIRMTDGGSVDGVVKLFCSAVSYLFADSLVFEIEYRNGSKDVLRNNGVTVNISDDRHLQQVEGRTNIGILHIILPENDDTAAIHCIATWWNETGERRTSKKFESKASEGIFFYCLVGSCGFLSFCGMFVLLLIFIKKHKTTQQVLRDLTDEEVEQFFKGRPDLLAHKAVYNIETADLLPFPKKYEIPLGDLAFDSEKNFLGFGNFSYVVRGMVISKEMPVAIKISKPTANVDFFKSLLSEVKIMVYIGKHENVLSLTGVCTENIKNRCIHIATDICELGDLKNFLMKARTSFQNILNVNQEIDLSLLRDTSSLASRRRLTILDLIRFSCEIAKGMEYLAYKLVVHADLAARNVLLTIDKVVKISDFGLSKKLYENTHYVKKSLIPLPWRWMAIESLSTLTFSTSSDVWSYGITLFEVFSLGDTPYPNEQWNAGFLARLEDGMRMGRPKHCTKEIYHLLSECWEKEPELRPGFSTIRSFFEKLSGRYVIPVAARQEDEFSVHSQDTPAPLSYRNKIFQTYELEHEPRAGTPPPLPLRRY